MATAGIMGTFPCVRNLPVRFTDTIDRNLKIFKHSRGVLVGWDLHEVDAERLRGFDGAEAVLTYKPKSLIVKIDGAEWQVHPDLPPGHYPLTPCFRYGHSQSENSLFELSQDQAEKKAVIEASSVPLLAHYP